MVDITRQIISEKEFQGLISFLEKEAQKPSGAKKLPSVVSGLCEGAEFALVNNLLSHAQYCGFDGVLLIVPDEKKAARFCEWLKSYGKRAMCYTVRDLVFYNTSASHEFEHERLFVLLNIIRHQCDYLVTTPDALMQYTIPKQRLEVTELSVVNGNSYHPDEIIDHLEKAGYHRAEMVESVGQYAVRGGIIDIFSPASANPVRLDFFGEEIDRMCFFDVMTQRRIDDCDQFSITPAREVIADADAVKNIVAIIKGLLKKNSVGPVAERLKEEMERISSGRDAAFLDKYISLVYPERQCLLDYAENYLPIVFEYGAVMDRLESKQNLDSENIKSMLLDGSIHPKHTEFSVSTDVLEDFIFDNSSVILSSMGSKLSGHRLAEMFAFKTRQTTGYGDRFDLLCEDLRGYMASGSRVKLICENEASLQNLNKMLNDSGFGSYPDDLTIEQRLATVALVSGQNIPGFELLASRYVVLTELSAGAVVKRSNSLRSKRRKNKNLQEILSYGDLSVGDFVVHDVHGIGQYLGMSSMVVDNVRKDFIKIKYAGTDTLYLPCGQLDKISKYIGKGAEDGQIKLSKMGGAEWKKAKCKAKVAAQNMAKQLIALYASRMAKNGISYPKDDEMQREFESAFEYEETDSQLRAVEEVKRDMESSHPMDRLLCGDVGYGKTEVALRAAFKAASGGYQVAVLVPTTILCMQHYRTFLSRMRGFPVSIDMVSSFKNKKQIDESLRKLRRGETDIIIGTHRLLSKDVEFKKLGLLVIDEEQRFGVAHKEKLKELSQNVDVLTLSATPIPRTLNMAMSGIRDMSVLDEAPVDRMPVQSFVLEHDEGVLEEAIRRELRRGGQVYYLCNNIEKMHEAAAKLRAAFPDYHVEIANGQMDKDVLSEIWEEMVDGNIDVLVTTTIIETGVDVPNANTLIIERADKLGLSQLHQIRGRVGRSSRRAYAYFTYPRYKELSEISEKRLAAIRDFTEFGSGFRIAMRDMEIRGVGSLLGAEQHGHMDIIGYDLYMKLLKEAVIEEKGGKIEVRTDCTIDLKVDAFIPESYIFDPNQRIDAYKKISLIETPEDISDVYDEFLDRFGEPPVQVSNLLTISLVRAVGSKAGISKILSKGSHVLFYPEKFSVKIASALAAQNNGKLMVTMTNVPYLSLRTGNVTPAQMIKACLKLLQEYILEKNKENT